MSDTWHTELTLDGDRWSFTLTQNGILHTAMANYRSREGVYPRWTCVAFRGL